MNASKIDRAIGNCVTRQNIMNGNIFIIPSASAYMQANQAYKSQRLHKRP